MSLPFTHDAFLDVFAAYNASVWPAVALLWVATAALVLRWLVTGLLSGRAAFGLLAVHWGWSAIAYHWLFFRRINPAAAGFAVMFAVQAAVCVWLAVAQRGTVTMARDPRSVAGVGLVLYGLMYPFAGLAFGLAYPRMPVFAVPCPTVLITTGWLLSSVNVPRLAYVVPVIWALVGSSAAFLLGIRADLPLVAAGVLLAVDTARRP